jgi:mannose-1-phosphate guanylyltransferase/mannose-6-phosphate isomerase
VQAVTDAVTKAGRDLGFVTLEPDAFGAAKAISIDYAVMEKTARAAVVPVACGWSDVGSWHAVWELSDKDAQGNAARGAAVFEDSRNCNVVDRQGAGRAGRRRRSRRGGDAGCGAGVAPEGCQRPEAAGREAEDGGAPGHRGSSQGAPALGLSYQSVDNGERHQVKRIVVKPGGGCRCRSITIAPSTGSWCAARRA